MSISGKIKIVISSAVDRAYVTRSRDADIVDVRAGSLKSVLRLLFNLSCYKQQLQKGQLLTATGHASSSDGGCEDAAEAPSIVSTDSPAMLSR